MTLEELKQWLINLSSVGKLTAVEIEEAIDAAEQRGMERAADEMDNLSRSIIPPKSDYDTASIAAFSYAEIRIRSLAQRGEK